MNKRDKKDDESSYGNPYAKIDKTSVLQETRVFNETPVNPRKCSLILTKILYLINNGQQLSTLEATDAFFNMTKLFQCKDTILRRLVYLGIKELSRMAENCYVVTASLTADMNAKDDQCKPAAMRALCQIVDATTFQGIERYMKQSIVDRNAAVSSAALVSSLHLTKTIPEGVKRWANEAQEAVNSDNEMVQCHALGLLYHIRKSDKLAVNKMVTKLIKSHLKSPYALCLLIRIAAKMICEEGADSDSPYFDFVESCLRHKSEMVAYESANAIINLKCTSIRELTTAISVLQLMLSSSKPTIRFAAVRTLNNIANNHPNIVTTCNVDLEGLITDNNRSIATLAITTLLKTGQENSVERLMKQIGSFMSEISDEFKIQVVEATRALCAKFPKKNIVMMGFLSTMLHEEGGFEYKKCIVDTIIAIIQDNPDAKELGLAYLCEFIEDCEHATLAVKILHLLGKDGPNCEQPSKYIRYIYNRLILEKSSVRAAAVSSLAKFAASREDLASQILVLLERSTMDTDDEVRDRSTYYLKVLQQKQHQTMTKLLADTLPTSIGNLEKALSEYLKASTEKPFDVSAVPFSATILDHHGAPKSEGVNGVQGTVGGASAVTSFPSGQTRHEMYAEQLAKHPEMLDLALGTLHNSSQPVELTESETEYIITCVKHMFAEHVVLQFDSTNTLNDQFLENVTIDMEIPEGFHLERIIPAKELSFNIPQSIFMVLRIANLDDINLLAANFSGVKLKYTIKDCDPNTGIPDEEGYQDEYALEDLDLTVMDYMQKVNVEDFPSAWDQIGEENEFEETYVLFNFKTLEVAIKNLVTYMGMRVWDRTDKVQEGKTAHTVYLAGVFRGGIQVLARAKLALDANGVTLKLSVRANNSQVSEFIASAIY